MQLSRIYSSSPINRPLPSKVISLIRPDFRCIEIVRYNEITPFKLSYKTTFFFYCRRGGLLYNSSNSNRGRFILQKLLLCLPYVLSVYGRACHDGLNSLMSNLFTYWGNDGCNAKLAFPRILKFSKSLVPLSQIHVLPGSAA